MKSKVIEVRTGSEETVRDLTGEGQHQWRHRHGSPGHGRDHVLPALCPPYATIPVIDGAMALGTWQAVCLVDLNRDNAERSVRLSFLDG